MRQNSMFSRLGVAMMIVLLISSVQQSFAAGTRAGTKLTSTATITYNDANSSAMTPVSGSVSIYVAHNPGSTVTIPTSNQEQYDGGYVVYTVIVTNNGNGQDRFQFLYDITAGSGNVDSIGLYKNSALTEALGGNSLNVLQDTVTNDGADTVWAKLYIKADGSFSSLDNQTITVQFRTRSTANMTDSAFANTDLTSPRAVYPANQNALSSNVATTTRIKQAKLTLNLTPGQSGYRPGEITGYNASITNSGTGGAYNTVVTVTFASDQSFSSGTNWSGSGSSRSYTLGTISAAGTVSTSASDSLKLLLADLASVLEGSTRTPTLTVAYDDSNTTSGVAGRTRTVGNSPTAITVLFKSFLQQTDIAIVDTTESGNPGDTATFAYTITNNSNGADGYNVRYSTASQGTWTGARFWYEITGAGFSGSQDSLFAAGGAGSDLNTTKLIAKGASITIYIRMAVPSGITTAVTHIRHLINSRRDSVNIPTDYNLFGSVDPLLPLIVVNRTKDFANDSISTGGDYATIPGDSVTFYINIENQGDGTASTVVITDDIRGNSNLSNPSNSAYIWDEVTGTEAANSDHVTIPDSPTTAGTLYGTITKTAGAYIISVSSLPAGAKRQVKYTLKIN
ncbi:MAG: hypothetical protein AB1728_00555 [Bacteroidota bacterium]